MKTYPQIIKLYGHDAFSRKQLEHVEEDLYKINFPQNPELNDYLRVGFTKDFPYEETGKHTYTGKDIEFVDVSGGPLLSRGYKVDNDWKVKDFFKTDKSIYIQIEEI